MLTACTIVARNYLPFARVLWTSFLDLHPEARFVLLLVDDESRHCDVGDARVDVRRLADLGLPLDEIRRLAAIYDVTELSTAVKPLLLRTLLDDAAGPGEVEPGRDAVLYLDPDIRVFGSLEPLAPMARAHGIVLTPHTTVPFPRDGRQVDGFFILAAGVYNLGFIAVGQGARPFLDWWWAATRREALADVAKMMFTDQRLIDFVPGFYDHAILKDPGYNVAYWNLHGRVLSDGPSGVSVNDEPLRFFHFSGFDPRRPWLLSKYQGERPRILLSEQPVLARLCANYAGELIRAGADADPAEYGWAAVPAGSVLTTRMRRLYWKALVAAEAGEGPEPPNPFVDGTAFLAWLNEPVQGTSGVSRFLYSVYEDRIDLQVAFRNLAGDDAAGFFDWIWRHGIAPELIPRELMPQVATAAPSTVAEPTLMDGVTIAGYFRAELGVGQAARLLTAGIEAAGIPHATRTYDATLSRQGHDFAERGTDGPAYDVNVLCLNADSTPAFVRSMGPAFFAGRRTVGYWFWETEAFAPRMRGAFDLVDEVWTATTFVAAALREVSNGVSVVTIPLPLPAPAVDPSITRASLGLPDRFLFLFSFDYMSVAERKNPLGLIDAFTRAFPDAGGPVLVLKTMNSHLRAADSERVRLEARRRANIIVIDECYDAGAQQALIGLCDAYVSLHRSEGLGLTMAEAMGLGKPVIATAYSGNLDFMTAENAWLVPFTRVPVPESCDPYVPGTMWADPDLDAAARAMREVHAGGPGVAARAARGRTDILTKHTAAISGAAIAARLDELRADRARMLTRSISSKEGTMTRSEGPADGAPAMADAVEALLPALEQLAVPRLSEGTAGGARLAAQKSLFRILRPYWFQQLQFHTTLLTALRRVAEVLRQGERRQDALERQVRELSGELVECRNAIRSRDEPSAAKRSE